MADRVRKVNYCYVTVSNRAGQGAKVLGELREAGVNLLAYSGFPTSGGMAQLDFVAEEMGPLRRVAKRNGWQLSRPRKGFLVQGSDTLGAVHRHIERLAQEKINVTAADAVCAGKNRYGMILWVKAKDFRKAARTLKAG